ncbi:MerC domain-containing protein [Sphingomonas profundi]|uniref:MerC domain-containing protein n=1 Tax=Alterirhizorhabdus profundi TaxID=2681549 RepID=UPI001E328E1A|nr:MerC domain-containing protein [Sphingomonas profundi]
MAQAKLIERKAETSWLDRVAIGLSGVCLVHCLATSVVLTLLASAGGLLLHPLIHEVGLALAIVLAALALGRGWLRHRAVLPAAIGGGGLMLMAAALTVHHGPGETVLTIVGVGLVALGHHLNRRALG